MTLAKDVADNASAAAAEAAAAATPKLETPKMDGEGTDLVVNQKTVGKRKKEKEKAERVRDEIERYCERFEKEVLRLFDRSYRKGDPRMMAVSTPLSLLGRTIQWSTLALREDAAGFQWRCLLRADIR